MECREFLLRYSEYDDSLIPAHEANRFRSHMAECPSCARYDRVLRKGRMLARQLPPPEAGDDFIPRLRLRLRETAPRRGAPGTRLAMGLAAATVLMAAAAALRVLDGAPAVGSGDGALNAAGAPVRAAAGPTPKARPLEGGIGSVEGHGWQGWGRVVALPSVERPGALRAWGAREVAPAPTASYSPLQTGPPVYRIARPSVSNANPDRRALD